VALIRTAAVSAIILFAFCVFAFWVVFERPHGTSAMIVAIIAQAGAFIPLAVVLGIILAAAASTRKPLRAANYPRIEHLRIAGKYHAEGTSAEMGISPLHLRG
jgi:hypothetical protein